jgi:hypothetical protein
MNGPAIFARQWRRVQAVFATHNAECFPTFPLDDNYDDATENRDQGHRAGMSRVGGDATEQARPGSPTVRRQFVVRDASDDGGSGSNGGGKGMAAVAEISAAFAGEGSLFMPVPQPL